MRSKPVCLISVNNTANQQLDDLEHSKDKTIIEKRLYQFAKVANKQQSGPLDSPKNRIKYMPEDLRMIRKHRIGRHRVFYIGHHTDCLYKVFFIKQFKKSDKVNHENHCNYTNL